VREWFLSHNFNSDVDKQGEKIEMTDERKEAIRKIAALLGVKTTDEIEEAAGIFGRSDKPTKKMLTLIDDYITKGRHKNNPEVNNRIRASLKNGISTLKTRKKKKGEGIAVNDQKTVTKAERIVKELEKYLASRRVPTV
jgi:hypothetical protein